MTDSPSAHSQTHAASYGNLSAASIAPKHPLKSRTIAGLIIAALPLIADLCGVQMDDAELQDTTEAVVQLVGLGLALYGRLKAKQPLAITPTPGAAVLLALIAFAVLVLLPGCASTKVFGPDGRPLLATSADADGLTLRARGTYFHADRLNHSAPTLAQGATARNVVNGVSGLTSAAGAAFVTGGIVK